MSCAAQPPIGVPNATAQGRAIAARTNSTNYAIVYSFAGSPDGRDPRAGLIDVGGTLYGTTSEGGSYTTGYCGDRQYSGCGTVFSVTTGGTEKVLHSFRFKDDGSIPVAGLTDVGGTLYGTTSQGGKQPPNCGRTSDYYGCGTVFSITPAGVENVLHSFGGANDGYLPTTSLTNLGGRLYGATVYGGTSVCTRYSSFYSVSCGAVFSITTGGTETVLHYFGRGHHARWPRAGLIDAGGKLYGTTYGGGAYLKCHNGFGLFGCGTVYSITPGGKERVIYSFGNGADGREPATGLIEVKGTFYGTTRGGGAYSNSCDTFYKDCGTVFSVTLSGTEKVLHSFGAKGDGNDPTAGLIAIKGVFYGTTSGGGAYGGGTVFSITPGGTENVLHSFGATGDGTDPVAGLVEVNGTLYGTTRYGGKRGSGTVFALTP
ncbi:MAG TPA: choice-of-anchor tandem repeat GloVer-containing protein [Candidatus Cybelea sp.]